MKVCHFYTELLTYNLQSVNFRSYVLSLHWLFQCTYEWYYLWYPVNWEISQCQLCYCCCHHRLSNLDFQCTIQDTYAQYLLWCVIKCLLPIDCTHILQGYATNLVSPDHLNHSDYSPHTVVRYPGETELPSWFLVRWQHRHQPIKSHVRKSWLVYQEFNIDF